jgi:Bacteriophage CI repressor helix-turn-helix domain
MVVEDAARVIDKLKTRFRVETDLELADKLIVGRSTISNWRSRGRIPERYAKIAEGAVNWSSFGNTPLEWSDVERTALQLALLRLIRDFGDIATDYRKFLLEGGRAAAELWRYHVSACRDLSQEMATRDTDNAQACLQIMVHDEFFGPK